MNEHILIVGGGLAGLAAGCYARASGFRSTIVEHNIALGGVCQAWSRGPYTIDGCIHWLTGGPFDVLYRELGIFPRVSTHVLPTWVSYRNVASGFSVELGREVDAYARVLLDAAPEDAAEIRRMLEAIARIPEVVPPVDRPAELMTMRDGLAQLWEMRHELGVIAHFRKPIGVWAREQLRSPKLRRVFTQLLPQESPTLVLLFTLGYLSRGWLSRPDGGTARFRDALIDAYHAAGGEEQLHATVDEILVKDGRAAGVRLADGTIVDADVVVSTASTPETQLRLLGGRYGADELRKRLESWPIFEPIVLASYAVDAHLGGLPSTLILDALGPFDVGGKAREHLYVRIYNDDASMAPAGQTVVQVMLATSYDWWAKRGTAYAAAKDAVADTIRVRLEELLPALRGRTTTIDVATPLTYWNMARSWRGAYEGWVPNAESFGGRVKKTLPGVHGLYLAGQWVEPGGGVPTALMSGRQAVQLLCAHAERPFRTPAGVGA